jgi:BirA family transcriptional regulator, biotin operon repressor / biotin---[acetyl-CoA-carboxylase] ligase
LSEAAAAGPSLPPLFSGSPAEAPFAAAIRAARDGTDAGLLTYRIRTEELSAALVLAPECPLQDAMAMVLAAANGFGDAFGALAPSEIACQFEWPGAIRINGARAGRIRAAASTADPAHEPDWLVVGLEIAFAAPEGAEPGETPDETSLREEGCGDIAPLRMLESWSRHTLVWIHEWLDGGIAKLHRDWLGRAYGHGRDVSVRLPRETLTGRFTGLDEKAGLLLTSGGATRLIPLTAMLEEAS